MSLLTISQSPHLKGPITTRKIMLTVILALVPGLIVQTFFYGVSFLLVLIQFVISCVSIEWFIQKYLLREKPSVSDGSAALTGVLLALNVPATLGTFPIIAGSIVSIGFGKMAFGGIGRNPFNPALVGRAFLTASFPVGMTQWPKIFSLEAFQADVVTHATPLTRILEGTPIVSWTEKFASGFDPLVWNAEILAAAYLVGALLLLALRIISPAIPLSFMAGLSLITLPAWLLDPSYQDPLFHIINGGTVLGAFYMATDYSTSPMIPKAMILYGLLAGILCAVIRLWGAYPDGVAYSILIMNAAVPLMNRYMMPKRFGSRR